MLFIETSVFTSDVSSHLDDHEYLSLQVYLAEHPEAGDLIEDTGGLRKTRWAAKGKGKSGGVRVIYYWMREADQTYMLAIYPKSAKDDLTDEETATLRQLVKEL